MVNAETLFGLLDPLFVLVICIAIVCNSRIRVVKRRKKVKRILTLAIAYWLLPLCMASTPTTEPRGIQKIEAAGSFPVFLAKPLTGKIEWNTVGISIINTADPCIVIFVVEAEVPKNGLNAIAKTTDGKVEIKFLSVPLVGVPKNGLNAIAKTTDGHVGIKFLSVPAPDKLASDIPVFDANGKLIRTDKGVILSTVNSKVVAYYKLPKPGFRWDYIMERGLVYLRQVPVQLLRK